MTPSIYHIHNIGSGSLFAMPMPHAETLANDLKTISEQGIEKILCLMQKSESETLGLQEQESITRTYGMEFQRFAIADYGVPCLTDLQQLIKRLHTEINGGYQLLVHCRGGIGRTGLICSCLLISAGFSHTAAIAHTTKKRQCPVPETPAQFELIKQFELSAKS